MIDDENDDFCHRTCNDRYENAEPPAVLTAHEKDKASFFAAIAADRTNDMNRLVFADWCDEHEESELAEMLRGGSRKWLEEFITKYYSDIYRGYGYTAITVDDLVSEASSSGGMFVSVGSNLHGRSELDPGEEELFWKHIQVMTGVDYDQEHRENFTWSCTC